ncbi:UV radiation resistance-associated gene protein [Galemys pyrenaicus]|uniref:UV radiation resistance-associated gene protein n=1 Tax=Galemys pyrenaicus TaxID=202257 RepID=A0A8J6DWX4_GALPY|nr:UV radiation resistance-associated gene protein [Galemys pyrenaicus]
MSGSSSAGGPVPLPPPGPAAALPPGAAARALRVELPSQQVSRGSRRGRGGVLTAGWRACEGAAGPGGRGAPSEVPRGQEPSDGRARFPEKSRCRDGREETGGEPVTPQAPEPASLRSWAFRRRPPPRRLRHLRNIAARNIVNRNGHQLLDTYFTLHLCNPEKIYKEFYRSEVIKNSLNPTWRSLDFGIMPTRLDTSVSFFVVKIWGGKEDIYQLLIEWKVCLDGLKYLGQQIHARNQNEIIFGLNDGYYGAPFEHKGSSNVQKNILQVDQNCVRNSYDVFCLLR